MKKYYECLNCEEVLEGKFKCCEEQNLQEISKDEYDELTDQNILYDRS